ncbi:MAG: histidinol-phosphatase HisJ family protein [Oscillospiraceae bacterium]|nr:histidinol-phosphatase HisJ family protein [Oscillospiraceae bacterium]
MIDLHTHTDFSFDGHATGEEMLTKAAELGLEAIAFTDHVEMDCYTGPPYYSDAAAAGSFTLYERLKERAPVRLLAGIEAGQPHYAPEVTAFVLSAYTYDEVVGSIHNLRGMQDFSFMAYEDASDETIAGWLRDYFEEERLLAESGLADILAHLTYPLRYIVGDFGRQVDLAAYAGQIDAVLKAVIRNGMALEINTSGLRQNLGVTLPDEHFLRRYRQLGGERITFGSDAHYTKHLGLGLDRGIAMAKQIGFEKQCLYIRRTCTEVPLG